jgi:hypothetical protein
MRPKPGSATRAPCPFRKAGSTMWAYLIKKIFGEDPLVCQHCGREMNVRKRPANHIFAGIGAAR